MAKNYKSILVISVFAVAVAYFFMTDNEGEFKRSPQSSQSEVLGGSDSSEAIKSSVTKQQNKKSKGQIALGKSRAKQFLQGHKAQDQKWLQDKNVSSEARILRMDEMGKDFDKHRKDLTQFVLSENPYAKTNREPHTYNDIVFRREAALRVHALKVISNQLQDPAALSSGMNDIINRSSDETMKAIAREVLEYRKKGRSFFNDFKNGIKGLKPPQD